MKGRIVDHSLNELGVHLDDETFDSDDVQLCLPERPKETIKSSGHVVIGWKELI